jgi:metallo-beta-lactamase family protein
MRMELRIRFLGASRNVTGSRCLVESGSQRILVDCGIHQERQHRDRDFKPFPVPPDSIDAVLLTHAHLDHCGYLPKLVREGFSGPVFCTRASAEVGRILMLDAGHLQEEDARYKRKRHGRAGKTARFGYDPLYTAADAEKVAPLMRPARLGASVEVAPGMVATFRNAGHILGSSFIRLVATQGGQPRSILFSGDVGRPDKPILQDPAQFEQADYVVLESTYGDRVHDESKDIPDSFSEVVHDSLDRGGNLLIPSFAIERAQEVLYHLFVLRQAKRIPPLMTFLDSPMAQKVTEVFEQHPELYDEEMVELMRGGNNPFRYPQLVFTRSSEQSKAINRVRGTVIVIAGSGMCTGGRIKHHLAQHINRKESTVLFVGYQAAGTLGREILDGAERVRILGSEYMVRARIARVHGFSAHADRDELLAWVTSLQTPPRRVFVNHGEAEAVRAFKTFLCERTGWDVEAPDYENEYVLD